MLKKLFLLLGAFCVFSLAGFTISISGLFLIHFLTPSLDPSISFFTSIGFGLVLGMVGTIVVNEMMK